MIVMTDLFVCLETINLLSLQTVELSDLIFGVLLVVCVKDASFYLMLTSLFIMKFLDSTYAVISISWSIPNILLYCLVGEYLTIDSLVYVRRI